MKARDGHLAFGVGLLAFLFVTIMALSWWSVESRPVPRRKIASLSRGMSTHDVSKLLGPPQQEAEKDAGVFVWTYGSPFQWYCFRIEFSPSSNVVSFYEDD
jgi:hypothetical protein